MAHRMYRVVAKEALVGYYRGVGQANIPLTKEQAMNIKNLLNSGQVVRFHNHMGMDKQSLAEHQWGVVMIVNYISPNASKNLILAAATHDAAEYYTGDVPFPTKAYNPDLKHLLDEMEKDWFAHHGLAGPFENIKTHEWNVLKVADILEGMWYCTLQLKCGNKAAARPLRKWHEHLLGMMENVKISERAELMLDFILTERDKWS
jgi:5'-deoxynucleotidase YfbR-like HD superfamily hydrolase